MSGATFTALRGVSTPEVASPPAMGRNATRTTLTVLVCCCALGGALA
jgi:hypothetical protein